MSETNTSDFTDFHSSVNRIPAIRDGAAHRPESDESDYLRDYAPQTLSEIRRDTLSGSISVQLTVETPLLLGEQKPKSNQAQKSADERCKKIITPIVVNDEVHIPPTSIKGMISNAYEAVTNSRFRLFGQHDKTLTYRIDPATSTKLVPVRIQRTSENNTLIQLLDGSLSTNIAFPKGVPEVPIVMAASLYDDSTEGITFNETKRKATSPMPGQGSGTPFSRFILATSPKEGKPFPEVYFDAVLVSNGLYAYWIVSKLYKTKDENSPSYTFDIDYTMLGVTKITEELNLTGYLYATTKANDRKEHRRTFTKKKSERVFFTLNHEPATIEVSADNAQRIFARYNNTIQSYIENHQEREQARKRRNNRNKTNEEELVPNRFITDTSWSIEDDGALAYAILSEDQQEIRDLIPITVGRASYIDSPEAIALANNLMPPQSATEASAADRLFGFTTFKREAHQHNFDVVSSFSIQGRLSFSKIDTSECRRYDGAPIALTPLLAPKPSSARRFLTQRDGTNVQPNNDNETHLARSSYFRVENQSLGRAAYPTHRRALKSTASGGTLRPYSNPEDAFTEVNSYILPGSKMTFNIRFEMLTSVELGILLWLLNPKNLVPQSERDEGKVGYLRLGMGKPLGLGTVKVEAIKCSLLNGQELAVGYQELKHVLGTESVVALDSYPVPANFEDHRWVQAFQRAAFGYSDGVEVRYMTRKENQRNNATDHNSGLPAHGCAIEPRQLFPSDEQDQSPLPIHVTTSSKTQCSPRH